MNSTKFVPCAGDGDCPGTLVCLDSPSWAAESTWNTCQCSPYYGWEGMPTCDQLGPAARSMASVYLIMAVLALLSAVISLAFVLWLLAVKKTRILMNSVIGTYILSLVALACCTCWFSTSASILLTPERYTLLENDANEGVAKFHELSIMETTFIFLALVTGTASILNICLVWIRVVRGTLVPTSPTARYLAYSRRIVYFSEVAYVVVLAPCFALRMIEVGILLTLPFYIFIGIAYAFAQYKLVRLLQRAALFDSTPEHQKRWYLKQIHRVQATATGIVTMLFVVVLFGCLYAGLYLSPGGWMEHAGTSSSLGPLQIAYVMVPVTNLSIVVAVMGYSCSSLNAIRLRAHAASLHSRARRGAEGNDDDDDDDNDDDGDHGESSDAEGTGTNSHGTSKGELTETNSRGSKPLYSQAESVSDDEEDGPMIANPMLEGRKRDSAKRSALSLV